ncbi:MAG: DUF3347 domain-containing protein [Flavobacteriaceae bacterium]|nr:DUF3347 domain-containing protein [Flavobacteriaceae bacterium]
MADRCNHKVLFRYDRDRLTENALRTVPALVDPPLKSIAEPWAFEIDLAIARFAKPAIRNDPLPAFERKLTHAGIIRQADRKTAPTDAAAARIAHPEHVVFKASGIDNPVLGICRQRQAYGILHHQTNQIDRFKKGQEVLITSNAYPNEEFKGKVSFIDPILNTKTRTVTLRVVLNNKDDVFKPGMFVTANIEGSTANSDQVLTIPASAVLWTGERSVVYLKTNPDQPVFEMREIKLGNQIGSEYEVLEGLFVGNEIVTNGTFTVDAAAQLQGKKSMMNKDGGTVMTGHEGHLGMDNNSTTNESDHNNMNERLEVAEKFQEQLKSVYNNYISLKDALVKKDSKNASVSATTLLINLNKVDMKLLSDNKAHNHWMSLEGDIKSSVTSISEASDIKTQRDHFKHLSSHLINAVQLFGVNEKVYVEFCPMADNNKGAYWLSEEEKVINPYFGDAMLTCGEVKQVIE